MEPDVNVLALCKGEEHYVFIYDDQSQNAMIDALRDLAANPEIQLNWFDAIVLTEKVREQVDPVREPTGEVMTPRIFGEG